MPFHLDIDYRVVIIFFYHVLHRKKTVYHLLEWNNCYIQKNTHLMKEWKFKKSLSSLIEKNCIYEDFKFIICGLIRKEPLSNLKK